ncbi:beclin 1 PWA37_000658 [Arxiozyma heterogenica]|uniref:Autophagy-related protein 6 n=1 Tax=Arxiozyma heterogenica TaxID=278026 RepID=A0AAN7WSA2_9SACH|nr:hypothetical protein RI543_004395 [Kazachstania heterogenica]
MISTQEDHSLRCQKCHLPLQLDLSLLDLSLSQRNLIVTSIGDQDTTETILHGDYFPKERLNKLKNVISSSRINRLSSLNNNSEKDQPTVPVVTRNENSQVDDGKFETDVGSSKSGLQSTLNSGKTLSTQISTLSNIFNILSSKSSIDYPICQDCCDILIQKLKKDYNETLEEKELYSQFLERLKRQHSIQSKDDILTKPNDHKDIKRDNTGSFNNITEELDLEYEDVLKEKDLLLEKLQQLEEDEENLDREISKLTEKLKKKNLEDDSLMEEINLQEVSQYEFQIELQNIQNQYETSLNNLDLLRKTNIYNETFKISHKGPFGTINGLRLGSIYKIPVSWKEINAALGQVVLLLRLLSDQLNYPLKNYRLEPLGSYSKILKYDITIKNWTTLEVYYDENFKFTKLFHSETNFDKSLESLLDIVQQLSQYILNPVQNSIFTANNTQDRNNSESATTNNIENRLSNESKYVQRSSLTKTNVNNTTIDELPYPIFDGKINSLSVTLYGKEPDIKWTTAMKFLLTNLKWLLLLSTKNLDIVSQ